MFIIRDAVLNLALLQECHVRKPNQPSRRIVLFFDQVLQNPLARKSRKKAFLMANTFSQIYIQTVFAVSGRLSLITPSFKEELHKYITGIVTKQGQKLIRINGMPDHLHVLIGL